MSDYHSQGRFIIWDTRQIGIGLGIVKRYCQSEAVKRIFKVNLGGVNEINPRKLKQFAP